MNNLFISYDLNAPGQRYDTVAEAIKKLGSAVRAQKSLWYVSSPYSAEEAAKKVWAAMDPNDSLVVVDATNKNAYWFNLTPAPAVSQFIQNHWHK